MTLEQVLRGRKATYFCASPELQQTNDATVQTGRSLRRRAFDVNNTDSGFYIKSWMDRTIQRCRYESVATTMLMKNGGHQNILLPTEIIENYEGKHFVYPYMNGVTLDDYIRNTPCERDFNKILYVLEEVAKGLKHVHAQQVVHRDVKPGNIFLRSDVDRPYGFTPVVFDWDVAGDMNERGNNVLFSGEGVGTPAYMEPLQCEGGRLTTEFDSYALGFVVYQMFDGQLPIDESNVKTAMDVMKLQINSYRRPLHSDGIPQAVANVVDRMVKRNRNERYMGLSAMVSAFREAIRVSEVSAMKDTNNYKAGVGGVGV